MKELREIVALWEQHAPRPCALATLVRTTGSSYRRVGARMLITSLGKTAGALSAGCIEDEIALQAREVIATGASRLVPFDTRRRFGCHGSIEIYIQRIADEEMSGLRQKLAERVPFELRTDFGADTPLVQTMQPAIRLLVVGDGVDTDALGAQARLVGWEVEVIAAITELTGPLDARTAAVVATHNFGRDSAALRHLLPLSLPYVGLIGPRRRREELLLDVLDSGAAMSSPLFAPAGLHLAAETPEEIALSIVAEIQSIFAGGSGEPLRHRQAPIHRPAPVEIPTGLGALS